MPSLTVLVNNVRKGESPLVIELPVGAYEITLRGQDPDHPFTKRVKVKILADETTTVNR